MRGVSLFSGAGIAEHFMEDLGIEIVVANELIEKRAKLYQNIYPNTKMIQGDILNNKVFNNIIKKSGKIDFLIASPPCQGMSIAGKNRSVKEMMLDERNHLILKVVEFIKIKNPKYILIENVSRLLKLLISHNGKLLTVVELLSSNFSKDYIIEAKILDAKDYGVPQRRKRAIIKMYKKQFKWDWPKKEKEITVQETIGHLPSIEAGESSNLKWHFARSHTPKHILWMKNTPTGTTAFHNKKHYPKKEDGIKIKGYESTYRRINWDEPSPAITIRNDAISSQRNVHPGRKNKNGTYSDARVLTPLELFLLTSLPNNWNIPDNTPEILIRQCIGEAIPPVMITKILKGVEGLNSL